MDIIRKGIRNKQKEILTASENKNSEQLVAQINDSTAPAQDIANAYPLLKDGYLVLYFESTETMSIKDLSMYLKYYGIRYTDDNVFQKINHGDVIFSILPDNETRTFQGRNEGSVKKIVTVMNFKKLSSQDYDTKICYELIMDVLEGLSKQSSGILMNEHGLRLTNKDKQNYLESII
jgi:hypothetical protein